MSGAITTRLINGQKHMHGAPEILRSAWRSPETFRGCGTEATLEGTWASLWDTRVHGTEGTRAQKQTLAKPCVTQDGRREEWGEAHEVSRDS